MVFVLFVISLLTFLLFEAIPNGNPAFRLAGRTATPLEIHQIEVKYGFDKPIYDPVPADDEEHLHRPGVLLHAGLQRPVARSRPGLPATLSLALGAGIIWLFVSIVFGTIAAIKAGRYTDRVLTVCRCSASRSRRSSSGRC